MVSYRYLECSYAEDQNGKKRVWKGVGHKISKKEENIKNSWKCVELLTLNMVIEANLLQTNNYLINPINISLKPKEITIFIIKLICAYVIRTVSKQSGG